MNKLKRSVIKEELVVLTGDYKKALMLNQFIYWSERVKDFDEFMTEEKERYTKHGKPELADALILNNGWIYKKSEELAEELMLDYKIKAMRAHLRYLVEKGWLDERNNPNFNWDKTIQYRVNLIKIQQDLLKLGYCLEGYSVNINFIVAETIPLDEIETSNTSQKETRTFEKGNGSFEKGNGMVEKERAIPETTTETTTEITIKEIKGKTKPAKLDIEKTLNDYTSNKELKTTIIQFLDMRKKQKDGITDLGITKMLTKLNKIGNTDDEKMEILDNSILCTYRGIFPITTNNNYNNKGANNGKSSKRVEDSSRDGIGFDLEA